jgi:hypothetical protein
MKYRIEIGGRGGEIAIGKVKREFYDAIQDNDVEFDDYAWNWDFFEENEIEIDEDIRPFEPGEWFECDDLCHNTGPASEDCYVSVLDENNNVIYDTLTVDRFYDLGADSQQIEEVYPQETLEDGDVYFIGQSFEKGLFLGFEIEDDVFDPKKLVFSTADCDGWELIVGVNYNGVSLDDDGNLSTVGKGSEFQLILVEKD